MGSAIASLDLRRHPKQGILVIDDPATRIIKTAHDKLESREWPWIQRTMGDTIHPVHGVCLAGALMAADFHIRGKYELSGESDGFNEAYRRVNNCVNQRGVESWNDDISRCFHEVIAILEKAAGSEL